MIGRKKSGVNLINKQIGKFRGIIDELEQGIGLCAKEIDSNNETIQTLTDKNDGIETSKSQASTFKDNLSNMLDTPIAIVPEPEKAEPDSEKKEDK